MLARPTLARSSVPTLVLLIAAGMAGCGDVGANVEAVELRAETSDAWRERGFVRMTAALRNPTSLDGTSSVDVWLSVPEGGTIALDTASDGPHLVLPAGTRVDRVESIAVAGKPRVDDVRGTELLTGGGQRFRVLRRGEASLEGMAWPRSDAHAQARVDDRLAAWLETHGARPRAVKRLIDLNQCARCHVSNKAPSTTAGQDGLPNRPTDGHGFYQVEGVLHDELPVETSRPRDPNLHDPFVTYRCASGEPPQPVESTSVAHVRCADGAPVLGRLDVAQSLAAKDPHALAVCETRRFLFERMTTSARNAFGEAFAVCGITTASFPGANDHE